MNRLRLNVEIKEENYERAIKANSAACLVADAIKEQYPELSSIRVDVATIRVTDRKAGKRYVFLTPPSVSDTLLFFDQGLKEQELPKTLSIRNLVRVTSMRRSQADLKAQVERRTKRLAELTEKKERGETLSSDEKRALTLMEKHKKSPVRPTSFGPTTVQGGEGANLVLHGGDPRRMYGKSEDHKKNPNLLAGRTRHFGAKTAKPSFVLEQIVKEALKEDRIKRHSNK
jgi:hypothetical protein